MIKITTSDKHFFEVEKKLIEKSLLVKNLIDDIGNNECTEIPLNNVSSETFTQILNYLKNDIKDIFFDMNKEKLFDLILAANYLDIENLLNDCCKKAADMIRGKDVEYIREFFGIE